MKEQDFIHNIEEKTKDLPIPDSISPEAMKKMLDENILFDSEKEHVSDTGTDALQGKNGGAGSYNRHIRRFAAAACVVLCLAGSFGISRLLSNQSEQSENNASPPKITGTEENVEDLITDTDRNAAGLSSPASYEEYYNALKDAYDAYYDSLANVTTGIDIGWDESELNGYDMSDAAPMDNAVAENADASPVEDFAAFDEGKLKLEDSPDRAASKEFSTTNTQEKRVDEGDVIKTDGTYIYKVISGFDNHTGYTTYRLTITRTDNGKLEAVASFDLEDILKKSDDDYVNFQEFYLYDNKLVFLYSKSNYSTESQTNNTYIVVYDVSDKENPTMVKTLSQSGWFGSSRISNGYLYTISDFSDTSLEDIKKYKNYIPYINGNPIPCENIYYPADILMETTHVITSLNLDDPKKFTDTKAIPSTGNDYYVSNASIYLYSTLYSEVTKTEIMKVGYKDGIFTVGDTSTVTGYLYDSFALNESNGYLRIVATIPANNISLLRSSLSDMDTASTAVTEDVNALYILDENMELTGKIAGIAPGEVIHSARFMGDIGYFVTYRNTDPLFSVDLSDPANPTIIGSLKITGFSEYLHFYGENTLLGIGQETDPKTQEFLGLKLSMFDISDPANVKEQDKYIIENSDYSEALYNHKAIMIDPAKNIFGFMYYGADSNYNYKYYYVTYTYDKDEGFIQTASYRVDDGSEYEYNAVRGVYIGDYFYLATNKSITSYKIGSKEQIASVSLK